MLVVIGVLRTVTKQFEKWIEKLDLDLTVEALFTWNGKNNVGSVGYELKKKLQYLRQLVGVCYCVIFLPGNNIRPESKTSGSQEITSDLRVRLVVE